MNFEFGFSYRFVHDKEIQVRSPSHCKVAVAMSADRLSSSLSV